MPTDVLLTRLLPPRPPPECLPRTDLVTRLAAGLSGRLVLVIAGAGYGKTTAVVQALELTDMPTAWLTCDERIGGSPDLLSHITAAIGRRLPGFGATLTFDGQLDRQVASLCNEIVLTVPDDIVLVLDDVHLLDPDASGAVAALVRDLPPAAHLVIVGREPIGLSLGRLRAQQVLEIDEADLVLSDEEVDALWALAGGPSEAADRTQVRAWAEGWLAAVILAARATAVPAGHRPYDGAFAFLAEEVLAAQTPEVRRFMLRSSILDRFSPSVAEAVTGTADAAQVCDELVRRRLFVVRLDSEGEWYRYHHLFRTVLRNELAMCASEDVTVLNQRAADAWLAADEPTDAIEHLLAAGATEQAASLVDAVADEMRLGPRARVLERWIAAIPQEHRAGRPALLLAHAMATFEAGRPEEGFDLLDDLLDDLIAQGEHDRAAAAFFALIYMQLAFGTRQQFAVDVGRRQLPRIADDAPLLPASMVLMASELGCAARYDEAEEVLERVLRLRTPTIDPLGPGYLASTRALFIDHPQGRSKQALASLDWTIGVFKRNARFDRLGYILALHCYRAILLNHLGRFDDALATVDEAVATARGFEAAGIADRAITKCRAVALAGLERWDELESVLAAAEPPELLRGSTYGVRLRAPAARLAAARGDADAVAHHAAVAVDYVEAFGFSFDVPTWLCDIAVSALQVGLEEEAGRLRAHAVEGSDRARAPWARARAQLLGSHLLPAGDAESALADALELTAAWGFDEIWTRRDRGLAAIPLARAIADEIGPPGQAARLAVVAGGEVLHGCAEILAATSGDGRSHLLEALRAHGVRHADAERVLRADAGHGTVVPPLRPRLAISALGGFSVRRGGEPIPISAFGRERARQLLGVLVCADGVVHRDQLLEWLWPDLDPARGVRALHVTLHALRRALEPELGRGAAHLSVVRSEGDGYRLALQPGDSVDVEVFLGLASSDGSSANEQRRARSLLSAERAFSGPLYPEWPYAEWSLAQRRIVDGSFAQVLSELGTYFSQLGRYEEAVARFARLVALEPEREGHHRALMSAYARAGEKALALRQFHACRAVLIRELGIEPSAATRELYGLILADVPVPDDSADRRPTSVNDP